MPAPKVTYEQRKRKTGAQAIPCAPSSSAKLLRTSRTVPTTHRNVLPALAIALHIHTLPGATEALLLRCTGAGGIFVVLLRKVALMGQRKNTENAAPRTGQRVVNARTVERHSSGLPSPFVAGILPPKACWGGLGGLPQICKPLSCRILQSFVHVATLSFSPKGGLPSGFSTL